MRLTRAQLSELLPKLKGAARIAAEEVLKSKEARNKYGNQCVKNDEGFFHSEGEYKRWQKLKLEARARVITDLQRQVAYQITVNGLPICLYIADFVYRREGQLIVEDFKGMVLPEYQLKKKLMKACHGIDIFETGKRARRRTRRKVHQP